MANELLTVEGIPELKRALATKVAELVAAATEVVGQEVEAIRADAEEHAPRLSGDLQEHVVAEHAGTKGVIRSTSRHALFVEHGTYKDAAQPYMRPAAERARKRFPARAAAIIRAALGG